MRTLTEAVFRVPVLCAKDRRIGLNLNVQTGTQQRYDAHVDSNPIQGLLYVTTHAPGSGGELVVANDETAVGLEEIDANASIVYPISGQFLLFDGRPNPHYVRPLVDPHARRVVVAINFYTEESPESERPADLSDHLFGADVNS